MVRFAFDIGTNSIGWAVLEPNEDDSKVEILDMGVRIFSDGREPSKSGQPGEPLNQTRRQKRMMRRQLERKKRRKKAMYNFLIRSGYAPADADAHNKWVMLDPYRLRAEALIRPLDKLELGRVMMQLAARRGFKSNRKTDTGKDASEYKQKISAFEQELGNRTLGQYLWQKKQAIEASFRKSNDSQPAVVNERVRFRPGTSYYPNRAMYEYEFHAIQSVQANAHPDFDWGKAYRIIFFQRPLKRPQRGYCTFFENEYRAYLAQPSAQIFKALQDINNLEYSIDHPVELTAEQKKVIFSYLQQKGSISFNKVRSLLGLPDEAVFNLEKGTKDKLEGSTTDIQFAKYIKQWLNIDLADRDTLVETFIVEENEDYILEVFKRFGITDTETKQAIEKIDLMVGVGSLSARFMRECSAIMSAEWIKYDKAVEKMGFHHYGTMKSDVYEKLPYYGQVLKYATIPPARSNQHNLTGGAAEEAQYGKISNPTVHIALNQLRKLCNKLIEKHHNKPDEIVVEVATELKLGREKIRQIIQEQNKNRKENEDIKAVIRNILQIPDGIEISSTDVLKFRLWKELGTNSAARHCMYCGNVISAHQLFNGEAEIEHILPFSRTLRNNRNNLTIAHKKCNAAKGNRTPYEAFGHSPPGYAWSEIEARVMDVFKYNFAKKNNFLKKDLEQELAVDSKFLESQLTDTAFIAKATREFLACLYPSSNGLPSPAVRVVPGRLTSLLRSKWGLNDILSSQYDEKNRADHRHHAIDALVIGLTTRSILQRFATANARGYSDRILPPQLPINRLQLEQKLQNMLISIKPEHGLGGGLFDETAYGFDYSPEDPDNKPKEFFVRKPVESLTWNIIDADLIVSPQTRSRINAFLNERNLNSKNSNNDNKKLATAMQEFSSLTGIKAVRIRAKNSEGYKLLLPGRNGRRGHKAYPQGDILFVDIWRIPQKGGKEYSFKGVYVCRADVHTQKGEFHTERPHPAAKFMMRLFKNDILALEFPDRTVLARIAGFSTTNDRIDLRPLHASGDIKTWIEQTNSRYRDPFWKPINSLQNFISLDVLVKKNKDMQIKHVHISIDGRLICRK
ncbi:MAG: type II CRISPR RNA-guided endonuclease Cas9 [Spirochaetaceae bacterium]|nr:type II CRISPR RNA-guided endonuclease Cas9 [Spirochaetaceae bacterium]